MTGVNCSICDQPDATQATKSAMYCSECYEKYYLNRQR